MKHKKYNKMAVKPALQLSREYLRYVQKCLSNQEIKKISLYYLKVSQAFQIQDKFYSFMSFKSDAGSSTDCHMSVTTAVKAGSARPHNLKNQKFRQQVVTLTAVIKKIFKK